VTNVAGISADRVEPLVDWLGNRRFGSTGVLDVKVSAMQDEDGGLALHLRIVLDDPRGETWPIEDVMALQRDVLGHARGLGITEAVYLSLEPETAPQADDEDVLTSS
jgi:hypothetical protein